MGDYLFFGSAVTSLANGAILLCVNPRRPINKVFFISSVWMAIWACSVAMAIRLGARNPSTPSDALIFWLRLSNASAAFIGWSAWLMRNALVFEGSSFRSIVKKSWLFLFVSCIAATIAFSEWYISSESTPLHKQRGTGFGVYTAIASVSCLYMLLDAFRHLKRLSGVRRIEMQFFVTGILCACTLLVMSNLLGNFSSLGWFKQVSPLWTFTAHAMAVWAVCYYRVFDAKQIIFSAGQRLILFGLVALFGVKLAQFLGRLTTHSAAVFLATATSCALAMLIDGPMRKALRLDLNFILQTPRARIIDWARQISDESELANVFETLLRDWCQTDQVHINSRYCTTASSNPELAIRRDWLGLTPICKEGWATPESLQRRRASPGSLECESYMQRNKLGAILAVPKGSASPSLIVTFGHKYSQRPYTFPDIQMLLELVELMDNILTHARASAHAAQIERMTSAAIMSRGLAHDLNNLATPVAAFLLHMETRVTPESPEAVVLADAKHSVKVMQDYIKESLLFARKLTINYAVVDTPALLASVAQLAQDRVRSARVAVVVHPTEGCVFEGDFALMQRALQNLVFNSIDASSPGDIIAISATTDDHQQVHLIVSDHGTGVPPEIRDKIFDPYFTTRAAGNSLRGLGLGLAICKKIAELHNGSVVVLDNKPRGAIFEIILPLRQPAAKTVPIASKGELAGLAPGHLQQEAASASSTL